jgi:hypothetical protein
MMNLSTTHHKADDLDRILCMAAFSHWPMIIYCACRSCLSDPARRARLVRCVETKSRAAGEGDYA